MADEFQLGSGGNWWDASSRNRFDQTDQSSAQKSSVPTTLNSIASFGWTPEMVADDKTSSSAMDTAATAASGGGGGGGLLAVDPNMHMMALGLSSQAMDWNHSLFHGEKSESGFRSMLQDQDLSNSSNNFQQETGPSSSQDQWREKLFSENSDDSNMNNYKQMNRVFSLDVAPQFSAKDNSGESSTITSQQGLAAGASFPVDSSAYGGLLLSENQSPVNFPYSMNYGSNSASNEQFMPSWNKFPQTLLRSPKQPSGNIHFTNKTPFWNASDDVRPSFFSSLPTPALDEKPKNLAEVRDLVTTSSKKTSTQASTKRPRNETPSASPAFKVRKEKMGDRITALQQLVSPFGKTDTASVLTEVIACITFLHEQVGVLSNPYMKSGAPTQPQQNPDKSKVSDQGPRQDLRSRGLCLVPISSTYPVTHETTADFWTPTFGGNFR